MARLKLRENGEPFHIRSLNLNDHARYKLYECEDCFGHVAWVKSKKGKSYLANVTYEDRVVPWSPHFKICAERVANFEAVIRYEEFSDKVAAAFIELDNSTDEDRDEIVARLRALSEERGPDPRR